MTDKIEEFLVALRAKLYKKLGKPALERDLEDPVELAENISHSIGSETQRITLNPAKHKGKEF